MDKKTILSAMIIILIVAGIGFYFYHTHSTNTDQKEQLVYEQTVSLSKKYLGLRYRTDNILIKADQYSDYVSWNKDMDTLIGDWKEFADKATELERTSSELTTEEFSLGIVENAYAYDRNEISAVFDKAPAGKKISTLANYLGVDAKRAWQILQQDQAQVTADAWNDAGDTFQKLETSAVVIKDGCKVAGFVGTIALTGGTAAIATGSTLTKVGILVSGADLTLEISDDTARIALGNHNKVSGIIGEARSVTEPLAGVLTIVGMPGNLSKGIEKLNAISFVGEQTNSAVQDNKIIGIEIPSMDMELQNKYENIKKHKFPIYISNMDSHETEKWLAEQHKDTKAETLEELEELLGIMSTANVATKNSGQISTNEEFSSESPEKIESGESSVIGIWKGVATWRSSESAELSQDEIILEFRPDKTFNKISGEWDTESWEIDGSAIKIYGQETTSGYYEFRYEGDTMTFVKMTGPDQEDPSQWVEVEAGSDFFGGTFFEVTLHRQ